MIHRAAAGARLLLCCLLGLGSAGCGAILQDGTSVGRALGHTDTSEIVGGQGEGCVAVGAPLDAAGDSNAYAAVLSMELDAAGAPTVAWSFGAAAAAQPVYVSAYDGAQWQGFAGSDSGAGLGSGNGGVGLQLDGDGRPAATWINADQGPAVLFKSWDGGAWSGLAGSDVGLAQADVGRERPEVRLVLDGKGHPNLRWQSVSGDGNVRGIQWDGGAWAEATPRQVINDTNAPLDAHPSMVRGPDGAPIVVYNDSTGFVLTSATNSIFHSPDGAITLTFPPGGSGTRSAAAVSASGNLLFAFQGSVAPDPTNIYVSGFSFATGPIILGPSTTAGPSAPLQKGGGQHASIAVDAQSNPVVVWESPTHQVMLRHHDGSSWGAPTGVLNGVNRPGTRGAWPVVRVANGHAIVAWHEDNAVIRVCSLPL